MILSSFKIQKMACLVFAELHQNMILIFKHFQPLDLKSEIILMNTLI